MFQPFGPEMDQSSIDIHVVVGHPRGVETFLEHPSADAAAEARDAPDGPHRLVDAIDDEAGYAVRR